MRVYLVLLVQRCTVMTFSFLNYKRRLYNAKKSKRSNSGAGYGFRHTHPS